MVDAFSSYFTYSVPLLLLSGLYVLWVDVKGYEISSMIKEGKVARFIGWSNIGIGVILFIARWAITKWGW